MTDLYRNLDISTRAMMKRQIEKEKRRKKAFRSTGLVRLERLLGFFLQKAA